MILDRGVCSIYRKTSTTQPGGKPTWTLAVIHESYYGELAFETSPARPTERREETQTAARIRILQNRGIMNQDVAELMPFDGTARKTEKYRIKRAYHGTDEDSGEPITDLTLEIDEILQTPAGSGSTAGSSTAGSGSSGNGNAAGTPAGSGGTEVTGG